MSSSHPPTFRSLAAIPEESGVGRSDSEKQRFNASSDKAADVCPHVCIMYVCIIPLVIPPPAQPLSPAAQKASHARHARSHVRHHTFDKSTDVSDKSTDVSLTAARGTIRPDRRRDQLSCVSGLPGCQVARLPAGFASLPAQLS